MNSTYWKKSALSNRQWTSCLVGVLETALLIIFLMLPGISQAECGDIPTLEDWEHGMKTYEGFYYNCRFHYGVSIPQGFVGMSVEPPAPQHGFGIIDTRYPSGVIWVSGNYSTSDEISSNDDLVETYLRWIKKDTQQIVSVQKRPLELDGLPALRLIIQRQCPDGKFITDDLVLTLQGGIEYSIHLQVDTNNYIEYVRLLEQLVSAWQFRGDWCDVFCGDDDPLSSPEEWTASFETADTYHMGKYSNCYYGYAVTIPEGSTGKSVFPTHAIEGFGILLSHQGYLRVEGGPNRFGWTSLEQAAKAYKTWISTAAHRVLAIQQESVTFGGLPALRLVARYECPAETIMVKDLFLAFREENIMYRLELLAGEEKYEEYKSSLEQIVNTFQLTEVLYEECQKKNKEP